MVLIAHIFALFKDYFSVMKNLTLTYCHNSKSFDVNIFTLNEAYYILQYNPRLDR